VVLLVHPQPPLLASGAAAPRIVLRDADGNRVDVFAGAAHHPVVLEFFTSTCANCRRQAPELCRLQEMFPAATVVGINAAREAATVVHAYALHHLAAGCPVKLLVDPAGTVSRNYQISVVPTVYVVDGNGKISAGGFGETTVAAAARLLRQLQGG